MKAVSLSLALLFSAVPGLCQTPRRSLASIFNTRLAYDLQQPDSVPVSTEVVTTSSNAALIAPNTWIEIHGSNLAPGVGPNGDTWSNSNFSNGLPTNLDGVTATVNGKSAAIYFVSNGQVNVLAPLDTAAGPVQVQLTNQSGTTTQTVTEQSVSLAFLIIDQPNHHVAAIHTTPQPNGVSALIAPPGEFPGVTTTGAAPGETVAIYATGFGQPATALTTEYPLPASNPLPTLPAITVGAIPATVSFAGLVAPGEYQFNVTIPANAPSGDQPLVATYNGNNTQAQGTLITIQASGQ